MRTKKRAKAAPKKKLVLHVAVVIGKDGGLISKRRRGDFAAFLSYNEEDAISRAVDAKEAWENGGGPFGNGTGGPYEVYVGVLLKKAVAPKPTYVMEAL